ncbi:MAG: serine/threonine protein kinase [Fibrobacter sp.]|nr:serine/threonine protein kinase [Fibrobacter sp.]
MSEALPKKIGVYKPTQFLGHGAMGNVYLCHDESLNRMVVVKQMVPSLYDHGTFVERFEREAKILAKLNHPVIVQPYALWQETSGQYSLAMEFVYGKSLRVLLDKKPKPPLWAVMEILYNLSSALAEAHRYGIIHRDIKPANIMIDKNGRVRLLDFGVAHDENDQELTEDFAQLGTASYMSPEQIHDSKSITPASDVFSIGIIACELLLGQNPFRGTSLAETFSNIQKKKVSSKFFDASVPKEMVIFIQKMLSKDPKKRPMANDVAEFFSMNMRRYPRDLRPYILEWANATLNEAETTFTPAMYSEKKKLSFKAGLITGAVVSIIAAIAIHFF